ncbi:transketolase [Thermanaerothrix daxensis]|uniref:Transketolase n=1 Tax=Thermanaerothrix daxensis TaxID=869279 RepID=A0A0P6XPF4_9CHLR|nr:transketolase [Thermanaerothrix daxensis]KPL84521.1 transketolase [Thermanaerothrix daxensis]
MVANPEFELRAINTLRFLSADAVQNANSGHPGLPMGAAAIAYAVWTRHLKHNPRNPNWPNRDRFILSGGHGCALLYSLLHLTGYDLSLDELKRFRQWGSKTPGHPEYGLTPGVETTTGPLGQGFANGVGMAIAAAHLAAEFNRPGFEIVDHYIYALVTDGDLMEGVASEAASLAGHLRLGRLIYLYDDNRISIDGSTDLTFTEDRARRFEAYGWQVLQVADGNDVDAIDAAIREAKADPRPSLIICRTQIGYGLPTRQGTAKAHGEPPGEEELRGAKERLGWPLEPMFYIPEDVLTFYRKAVEDGAAAEAAWQQQFEAYRRAYPEQAAEFERRMQGRLPEGWDKDLPVFDPDPKGLATRAASGKVLNVLATRLPELMGGSADLTPSNNTWMNCATAFQAENPIGRYLHFGVREHGMGAIVNGMALYRGIIPFGATFLVFSDYMRPAVRLSALSHIGSIWIFTHDSIGLGEDGPTHQPIEHLPALRAIPNLVVIRPADANEVREAWKVAIERRNGPTALVLSRQAIPVLDRSVLAPAEGLRRGAYVLADLGGGRPQIILMATGSEVSLIVEAGYALAAEGYNVRLVSFPSWELFEAQDRGYQDEVLPPTIERRLAIEAARPLGWERWVGNKGRILGIHRFGASAPYKVIYEKFGLTVADILREARGLLGVEA